MSNVDSYPWNNSRSTERKAIEQFLSEAEERIRRQPSRIPFRDKAGHIVIAWLRGLVNKHPSEMMQ